MACAAGYSANWAGNSGGDEFVEQSQLQWPTRDVEVADIGIPARVIDEIAPNTWENGPELRLSAYPWPQPESYKFKRGAANVRPRSDLAPVLVLRPGSSFLPRSRPDPQQ